MQITYLQYRLLTDLLKRVSGKVSYRWSFNLAHRLIIWLHSFSFLSRSLVISAVRIGLEEDWLMILVYSTRLKQEQGNTLYKYHKTNTFPTRFVFQILRPTESHSQKTYWRTDNHYRNSSWHNGGLLSRHGWELGGWKAAAQPNRKHQMIKALSLFAAGETRTA